MDHLVDSVRMSALTPKADMVQRDRDVRFVPINDIPSFDHFVGECPGNERFDAQNEFKLVCLFDSSHLCHSGL